MRSTVLDIHLNMTADREYVFCWMERDTESLGSFESRLSVFMQDKESHFGRTDTINYFFAHYGSLKKGKSTLTICVLILNL